MANIHAASSQWSSRPADERFWNLTDMHSACAAARAGSKTATRRLPEMRTVAKNDGVMLVGPAGNPAHMTHYAFGQLARSVGAPADYLRGLPAATAVDCLNVGLQASEATPRDLLFHANGGLTLRACLSDRYERVWDDEVVRYLRSLEHAGWRTPAGRVPAGYQGPTRAAEPSDILPGQINISAGDQIAPSGLYASDHDMFAFLVAPDRVVDDGAGGQLMRGVFAKNSEVGDSALVFTFFLMQAVCGNHIVWNASGVHEIRVRHIGHEPLTRALHGFEAELRKYRDAAPEEERMIVAARKLTLGATKDEVLDAIIRYAKGHSLPLSRRTVGTAYDVAAEHMDWYGDPRTLWGVVAGLTQGSQGSYADARTETDRAAGKLLEMVDF